RWDVPEAVGRAFYPMLSLHDQKFPDPGDVTEFQITGRVASVREEIATIDFQGRVAGTHDHLFGGRKRVIASTAVRMIDGVGAYDIRAGQMLSLTWVWEGLYWEYPDPSKRGQPERYGAVVEWRRGDPDAAAPLKASAPGPGTDAELADATPEGALK